jgi:DNA-binding transcriptional regulator YiaG
MYHYKECGLNDVWLSNGYRMQKTPYGEALFIEDVRALHRAIAARLIRHKPNLSGAEFRFLRKELDMSQKALAEIFGKDVQSIARWEKQSRAPKMADRMLRMTYRDCVMDECFDGSLKELVLRLNDMDQKAFEKLRFKHSGENWKLAA